MTSQQKPQPKTDGMVGEDFNYGGAGSESDSKAKAVVSGEEKAAEKSAVRKAPGTTDDPDWGKRSLSQQVPGGLPDAEKAGKDRAESK